MNFFRRPVLDTETYRIGPGAVVPKLVCVSFSETGDSRLLATADAGLEKRLEGLFTPGNGVLVVFHHAAFDVPVLYRAFPRLQSLIWQKIAAEEITCTIIRQMLLNLATHGKLDMYTAPDGSNRRLLYGLDSLVQDNFGVDISSTKKGEDSVRRNFDVLDGLRAEQYPKDYYEYAVGDASWTERLLEAQDAQAVLQGEHATGALDAARFHTAAAISLAFITERGMKTDEGAFNRLCAMLDAELSEAQMMPLIRAGIMEPAIPPLPYKQDVKKAEGLLAEWLGREVDLLEDAKKDPALILAMRGAGIRVKEAVEPVIKQKHLKRHILAVAMGRHLNKPVDALLQQYKEVEDMEAAAASSGLVYEKTDTGGVATGGDVLDKLADGHPALVTYKKRQKLMKLVSTEIPRMQWNGKLADVVHFPFKPLLETGRTSSSATELYPSANGQNVDPRAREMYIPREGYLLCSCDFSALELVCVGQVTYDLFGKSRHRDLINEGIDLHAWLGSRLAYELSDPEFVEALLQAGIKTGDWMGVYKTFKGLGDEHPVYRFWRKLAKPVGLGFPSGLGAATMVELAMADPYRIDMLAIAAKRFETHRDEFPELKTMYFAARKLHGMTRETLEWTPQLVAVAFAMNLRKIWLDTYPEMHEYFARVKEQKDPSGEVYFFKKEDQERYRDDLNEWGTSGADPADQPDPAEYGGTNLLCYTTKLKMHRARCTFTAVSNGMSMQSPGAEGAKSAVILTVRDCLDPSSKSVLANGGGFVVDFIHDELLAEVKNDELAHERAMRIKELMEQGLRRVITDVNVKAQPVLMDRWYKDIAPTYEGGRLVVSRPIKKTASQAEKK